jgi:hypothetical protein
VPASGIGLLLAAMVSCSSYLEDASSPPDTASDTTPQTVRPPANPPSSPALPGMGGTGALPPVAAPPSSSEGQGAAPLLPPASGGTLPTSTSATLVGDVCSALGSDDACGNCVCGACASELEICAETPGCAEILTCVRESGCAGSECYCGDERLTQCAAGGGNGPCKAAVLAAPGGKEPTLLNPSGGPASDAALAIANCAEEDNSCADVCDVDG